MGRNLFHRFGLIILILSVFITPTHAVETIRIGAIFAKTGMASSDGLYNYQAVRFAVNEINAKGGILGKKLELLEWDNNSKPIHANMVAKKAIEANVALVIGAAWSSLSMAMAKVMQQAKIPMITPVSTNPDVTKIGNYIFRVCFTDVFQGKTLAKFAKTDLKAKTAALCTDITSDYSLGLSNAFRESFEQLQGKIVAQQEYKHRQYSFEAILSKVKQVNPDIFLVFGHAESGLIVRKAQAEGITAIMLGGDGWEARDFLVQGGLEIKEGYFTTHWSEKAGNPVSMDFVKRYRQYNEVNALAALAYDTVMLAADAILRAGSLEPSKIRESIAQTHNFQGVTGKITFDKNGDPIKSVVIKKIADGQVQYLKTIEPID